MKSTLLGKGLAPLFALSLLLFTQCKKDDTNSGNISLEITDAPIDDVNVQGAFVTIADVKIDGNSMPGFSGRQTIDLLAYQQGDVKSLGIGTLSAGTYNNVTLVLDYDTDANGGSPGCYVLTMDGVKHALKSTANTTANVTAAANFVATENDRTDLVLDFDVRKAIAHTASGASQYQFNGNTELNAAVRVVTKAKTGTIGGTCTDPLSTSQKIVAYAYKKGSFNAAVEKQGPVQFKNAVTSAAVDIQGRYTLAFLEEGDYELHFIRYNDANSDGRFELEGSLLLNIIGALDVKNISVGAQANITLNVVATGILPL
ncbi:MAG: DUF4382 domain-containing protein [Saprospiraceae bacterium]|nr:DUF4382 domain-containing protein [Saprospiraceae bacterium]